MAEEETKQNDEDGSIDEAAELEGILNSALGEEDAASGVSGKLKSLLHDKRILIGLGVILLILIAGGLYWYLSSNSDIPNEKIEKPSTKGDGPSKDNEKIKEKNQIEKINVFPLEPFFIPLELDNPATGQFVSIKLSFVISNRKMNREINKNIGEIRRQIYHILRGKKAITYIEDMENLKKGLKQEIATISNNLLVSGAGTISEVLFTDFVIR